ncbi:MAG: DUF1570 domain-containing protein [Prosthecobacter sp.]
MTRSFILLVATSGVAAGVLWMKKETPNPAGAVATREAPLVEARSLKPLLETANAAKLAPYAAKMSSARSQEAVSSPQPKEKDASHAMTQWPREVVLRGTPQVHSVSQDAKSGEYVYQTEHFEFSCDIALGVDVVRHFAHVFEATHLLNCQLPLDLKPAPESLRKLYRARILSKDADYTALRKAPGGGGFYSSRDKCMYVPASSLGVKIAGERVLLDQSIESNSTLIHEITHQMMNRWVSLLPLWLLEGSAEYVASADFVHGRFSLGQMEDRLKQRLRSLGAQRKDNASVRCNMLNVAELLKLNHKTWSAGMPSPAGHENYTSALLLTYYLYHLDRGREGAGIIAMLRAVGEGMPHEDALRQFILAGRKPAELEGEIGMAFARMGVELKFTRRGGAVFEP